MLRNNYKKLVLLIALSFLLVGIVSAAGYNDASASEHNVEKSVKDVPALLQKR